MNANTRTPIDPHALTLLFFIANYEQKEDAILQYIIITNEACLYNSRQKPEGQRTSESVSGDYFIARTKERVLQQEKCLLQAFEI